MSKNQKKKREYRLSEIGRARLRESVLRNEPWRKSTGPRTMLGKVVSRQNAMTHGMYSRWMREERAEFVRFLRAFRYASEGK